MNKHLRTIPTALAIFLISAAAVTQAATTNTWTGAAGSDWFDNGNWDQGYYPLAGEAVVILNAGNDPVLTNSTPSLDSFVISNKTLTCSNWTTQIIATEVTIRKDATITLPPAFTNNVMSNRVYITCTDLTIDAGGKIDAQGKGFGTFTGPGKTTGGAWHGAGAGHGGRGGGSTSYRTGGGPSHGSTNAPLSPGSGGTAYSTYTPSTGGGAVRIDAAGGTVTINGTISANATDTVAYGLGAGAGGSIYITCNTFAGSTTGLLNAKGGSANTAYSGGGGGGRIAVDYTNLGTPHAARFVCSEGAGCPNTPVIENSFYKAKMGTLWLPDSQLLATTLADELFTGCDLVIPGFTAWSPASLTISNCSFHVAATGFRLTVTGDLVIHNGSLGIRGDITTRGGDLVLTNGAELLVYSAATNSPTPGYGALVSVTGDMVVADSSWVYPYAEEISGGGVLFRVSNLVVRSGAGFNADGLGFGLTNGPGRGAQEGHGSGAGYGGKGGQALSYSTYGVTYGSASTPMPGSGTGGRAGTAGAPGGGCVRIEAENAVTVDGTISANGGRGLGDADGCASGGGIYITCQAFGGAASGLMRANGGPNQGYGGGGGGGRIAVHYTSLDATHAPRFTCSPGPGHYGLPSEDVYVARYPLKGTVWLSDSGFLSSNMGGNQFQDVRLIIPSFTSWNLGTLTVSDWDAVIEVPGLTVTVTNGVRVDSGGKLGLWGNLVIPSGDLVLTNGGLMRVYASPTNASPDYGALVSVTGDVWVGASSWIYPYSDATNGGSPLFRMSNLWVAAGGGFDAVGRGFEPRTGPGSAGSLFHGPGGGHGGKGGPSSQYITTYGASYDSTNAPRGAGSGGSDVPTASWAGSGGGVVRIEAGDVTLDGTLLANGYGAPEYRAGSGAGGSVFVFANSFAGAASGLLSADGGDNPSGAGGHGGGGGGGRASVGLGFSDAQRQQILAGTPPMITVYQNHSGFNGSVTVDGGVGWSNGWAGTKQFMAPFTWILTISGDPGNYDSPHPHSYGEISTIPAGSWVTNWVNSPADEVGGARHACLGWTLTNALGAVSSGSTTQAPIHLTTNLFLTWHWTNQYLLTVSAGPDGSVNSGVVNGWYTNAVQVTNLLATPDPTYTFTFWSGDVPSGAELDNPLTVTMDQARSLQANFASATPQTRYWNGTGAWESTTNWTPPGMPAPYDEAVIESGIVKLAFSRSVGSLVVSNAATMVFTNWTTKLTVSNDVVIRGGGTITLPDAFKDNTMSNRIWVVCSNFLVEATGKIDVDGRGFYGNNGPGAGGGGWHSTGGGHGGKGGLANNTGAPQGATYGSLIQPSTPGSGGGGMSPNPGPAAEAAGRGGGVVRIDAGGTVTLDGTITADGTSSSSYGYGGGAGGSVWITCDVFGGSGLLSADGAMPAPPYHSGGGGGGRIAVDYQSLAAHAVRYSCSPGYGFANSVGMWWGAAEPGTLHLADDSILSQTLSGSLFTDVKLYMLGVTSWAPNSLTVSNCSVTFAEPGFQLTVTNNVLIGANGVLGIGETNGYGRLACGNLALTNGGALRVYSGSTNGTGRAYGALVEVVGDVVVSDSSWIYPYSHATDGGSVRFSVGDLLVASNAGFYSVGAGYAAYEGPGGAGYDFGGHGGGAGYGGVGGPNDGGNYAGPSFGMTNGLLSPGCGGGGRAGFNGGRGGGLIWVEADRVTLDGTINADGAGGYDYMGGGGSGGGIWLRANATFSGGTPADIHARGGDAGSYLTYSGSGGGGRIAVWIGPIPDSYYWPVINNSTLIGVTYTNAYDEYLGTVSATNGINRAALQGLAANGTPGTIVFVHYIPPPQGSLILVR